jgi:hypothetical protein
VIKKNIKKTTIFTFILILLCNYSYSNSKFKFNEQYVTLIETQGPKHMMYPREYLNTNDIVKAKTYCSKSGLKYFIFENDWYAKSPSFFNTEKYFQRVICAKSLEEIYKDLENKLEDKYSVIYKDNHALPFTMNTFTSNIIGSNSNTFNTAKYHSNKLNKKERIKKAEIEEKKKKEKLKFAKLEEEKKAKAERERKKLEREKYTKDCEPSFGGLVGYKQGTPEYEKCIDEKIAEAKKAKLAKLEEEKLKKLAAKREQAKLAKMSADDRRDYTCEKKFGFRKGSNKFNDCRFKLFTAEMELQKIQMQKELAEAKAEAAKARADAERARAEAASTFQARQEALLRAQTSAAQQQAAAAKAQAQASNMQRSLQMINQGLNMMSGPRTPSLNLRTTCSYTGSFLNCF